MVASIFNRQLKQLEFIELYLDHPTDDKFHLISRVYSLQTDAPVPVDPRFLYLFQEQNEILRQRQNETVTQLNKALHDQLKSLIALKRKLFERNPSVRRIDPWFSAALQVDGEEERVKKLVHLSARLHDVIFATRFIAENRLDQFAGDGGEEISLCASSLQESGVKVSGDIVSCSEIIQMLETVGKSLRERKYRVVLDQINKIDQALKLHK